MATRTFLLILTALVIGTVRAQEDCVPTASIEPLDTWQTVSGEYDADGWMIFDAEFFLGVDYVFKTGCGDGATADHNTVIEWMTPICTTILSNDDGCENGRSSLSFNSFFDETVLWIRVRGAQGQGGSFTMAYRSIGGVPGQCNECPSYDEQLMPSSQWQSKAGAYGTGGCKVYRVFSAVGMEYTFKTGCGDGAIADHDTFIEVQGVGCATLSSDEDGCEAGRSQVTWMGTGGIIYVKVISSSGSAGTFSMAYRRSGGNGSLCGTCTEHDLSITPGVNWSTSTSSYLSEGCQIYRVSVTEGFMYTFKTGCGNGATADHDTFLELFDPDCGTLAMDNDGCENGSSMIEYIATSTGFLYLKVSGIEAAEGFYTLAYRKSGSCTDCPSYDVEITPTLVWQTATGAYLNDGCWLYKVNVTEEHTYAFQTGCGNGGASDHFSTLQLLDPGCTSIQNGSWGCNGPGSDINYLALETGVVYLKVYGLDGTFGTHTLAYRDLGSASDECSAVQPIQFSQGNVYLAGALTGATSAGDFVESSPYYGSAVMWYAFELEEPCYGFTVAYCGLVPAWGNTLNILTTDCPGDSALVASVESYACEDGNGRYSFPVLTPGVYYLPLLYDPLNSVDGDYEISVTCNDEVWLGAEETIACAWTIHPNPGLDELRISCTGNTPRTLVRIHDPLGRQVWSGGITAFPARIDTGSLPPGMYMVVIQDGNRVSSFTWIKE